MVGIPRELIPSPAPARLLAALTEAEFPGDTKDHHWIASRLHKQAARLNLEQPSEELEDLLLAGLLRERGFDPENCPHLHDRAFPESWLRAAPVLLRCRSCSITWPLIRNGVLRRESGLMPRQSRWRIDGEALLPLTRDWHELGEHLMFANLARTLVALLGDDRPEGEVKITGVSRDTGRRWLKQLQGGLCDLGVDPGRLTFLT